MPSEPDDGLTDELAEQIARDIDLGREEETRGQATVRPAGEASFELVLYDEDEDGEQADVVAALTRDEVLALAAMLVELAGEEPGTA